MLIKKTADKKSYLLPLSIAGFVIAAALIFFFMKHQAGTQGDVPALKNAVVVSADSAQDRRDTVTIATKTQPLVTAVKDSVPKQPAKENIDAAKTENNEKAERQHSKKETATEKPVVKTAGIAGNTYVLELNTALDCTIKVNGINYGEVRSGGKLKVWLQAGTYQIKALSTTDNTEVFSKSITVGNAELGTAGRIRIAANCDQ